jgi:lipid-binding SYLF domain-containing protein
MTRTRVFRSVLLVAAALALMSAPDAVAASRKELNRDGINALKNLYATNPAARRLGEKARAVLVFPNIVKAGFMFGGQIGEGVLLKGGKPVAYYNSVAASYGLQAGIQGSKITRISK